MSAALHQAHATTGGPPDLAARRTRWDLPIALLTALADRARIAAGLDRAAHHSTPPPAGWAERKDSLDERHAIGEATDPDGVITLTAAGTVIAYLGTVQPPDAPPGVPANHGRAVTLTGALWDLHELDRRVDALMQLPARDGWERDGAWAYRQSALEIGARWRLSNWTDPVHGERFLMFAGEPLAYLGTRPDQQTSYLPRDGGAPGTTRCGLELRWDSLAHVHRADTEVDE